MDEEAPGTRTESSGGAGDHPPTTDDQASDGDPAVGDRHEEATRELRESNPPVPGEETSGTTSGG
jgi:hypothetical protein